MTSDLFQAADGSALLAAFERAAAACGPDAAPATALEAAAMGVALAELGLVTRAAGSERVVSVARRTLLGAGALRASARDDEDALDALDLAIDQARRGVALLGGAALATLDGAPTHEPTPRELARLLRGELDGHAAADVAIRLHRSGARDRYAAFLPSAAVEKRVRLAADSAPVVRDPAAGRALGAAKLGTIALEAVAFEGGVVAVYAEPAVGITLVACDAALASRPIGTAGYLELVLTGDPAEVELVLGADAATVRWKLRLAES